MKKHDSCEMCGAKLHPFTKGYLCSAACRKAKSRLKAEAGKNMIDARNAIRRVIKGLDLDMIDSSTSYDDFRALIDVVRDLKNAHNARYSREQAEYERRQRKAEKS